jgi:hypothetical protein
MSVTALLADRKNTRVALAAALVEANTEREALRAALSLARVTANAPVTKSDWPTAPRKLPPHFVAAREMAMRSGRVVRVGA